MLIRSNPENSSSKIPPRFLEYDWKNGNLKTIDDKVISNISFKYNISEDKFEMRADVNPTIVDRIYMEDKAFIYISYFNKGVEDLGFFEVISEGNAQLLLRYTVKTKPGREGAFGYEASQKIFKQHYIRFDNNPAIAITKQLDDILFAFPDKQDEIAKFVKKENLSPRKEGDLIKLIVFYNSL